MLITDKGTVARLIEINFSLEVLKKIAIWMILSSKSFVAEKTVPL